MKTLSFIIPVYNEENRIHKTFTALKQLRLNRDLRLVEIIFINDGSTDKTAQLIKNFAQSAGLSVKITLLTYKINKGKGYALRQGMRQSTADYTLFFDADISTPLSELAKFKPYMDKNIHVIIGTRKNGRSTVTKHQPLVREMLGKIFTRITQLALATDNTDFTCGFKAFSKKAKHTVFSQSQINRWGYDAEILLLTKLNNFSQKEVAVSWADDSNTRVRLGSAVITTLIELTKLVWLHRIKPWIGSIVPSPLLTRSNLIK